MPAEQRPCARENVQNLGLGGIHASKAAGSVRNAKNIFCRTCHFPHHIPMVIERPPLEDELGDVLEKALRLAGCDAAALAARAGLDVARIRDAMDYRHDFTAAEVGRLAVALGLNEVGLAALAGGRYPLPEIAGLPFCVWPLRMPYGVGVANAYLVADCAQAHGILFDAGADFALLRRVWPKNLRRLDAVFVTHAGTEHVGGLAGLLAEYGPVPVYAPAVAGIAGARALDEGALVEVAGFAVRAWSTPGHAAAHNCYEVRAARVPAGVPLLVSGDLLFAGSAGGCYFSAPLLRVGLARLLAGLPPETVVAPGHGPLTTILNERTFNPFAA
jgi:hydroxyacylglutathione hydrolase